jgi:hypothetical protein
MVKDALAIVMLCCQLKKKELRYFFRVLFYRQENVSCRQQRHIVCALLFYQVHYFGANQKVFAELLKLLRLVTFDEVVLLEFQGALY